MQRLHRKSIIAVLMAPVLLVPLAAHAFFGTMPVVDWTAIVRIGQQIGISQETLNTLGLYVQQYNRINAGVQEGIVLVRGRQLQGLHDHRLLARLMRLQALSIARENSMEKEQEQVRQAQLSTVSSMVGSMQLSYGIGDRVGH